MGAMCVLALDELPAEIERIDLISLPTGLTNILMDSRNVLPDSDLSPPILSDDSLRMAMSETWLPLYFPREHRSIGQKYLRSLEYFHKGYGVASDLLDSLPDPVRTARPKWGGKLVRALHGSCDAICPIHRTRELLAATISDAQVIEIGGAGHFPWVPAGIDFFKYFR